MKRLAMWCQTACLLMRDESFQNGKFLLAAIVPRADSLAAELIEAAPQRASIFGTKWDKIGLRKVCK